MIQYKQKCTLSEENSHDSLEGANEVDDRCDTSIGLKCDESTKTCLFL